MHVESIYNTMDEIPGPSSLKEEVSEKRKLRGKIIQKEKRSQKGMKVIELEFDFIV